jgi:outer membrane receptor protein involved in Fe transport
VEPDARLSTGPNHFDQSFTTVAAGRNSETLTSIQGVDTTGTRALVEIGQGLPFGLGFLVGRVGINRSASDFEVATPTATTTRALRDDSEAVSVQAGFTPANGVTFGGGIRHEWRAAPEGANSREGATVGHVSGAWNFIDYHTTVRGSFGTSHRWPTLNELVRDFRVGNVLTTANPNLLPERARSGDVAVTYDRGTWSASATGFWTVVEDAIASVTLTSTPSLITRQRQNAGEAHAQGVELEGEVRPLKRLRVRASAVIMDARFRESLEPALEGNRLPQVPGATFGVGADATLPWQLAASVFVRTTGDQYDDDRNQFLLADATQIDLRVAGRFGPGGRLGWHFVMENAADARIEVGRTPLVTLAPGRVVRAGFSFKF